MPSVSQIFAPLGTLWMPAKSRSGDSWETDQGVYDPEVYWEINFDTVSFELGGDSVDAFTAGEPPMGMPVPNVGSIVPNNIPANLVLHGAFHLTAVHNPEAMPFIGHFLNQILVTVTDTGGPRVLTYLLELEQGGTVAEAYQEVYPPSELGNLFANVISMTFNGGTPSTIRIYPVVTRTPTPREPDFDNAWQIRLGDISEFLPLAHYLPVSKLAGMMGRAAQDPGLEEGKLLFGNIFDNSLVRLIGQDNILTQRIQGDWELGLAAAYPISATGIRLEVLVFGVNDEDYRVRVDNAPVSDYGPTNLGDHILHVSLDFISGVHGDSYVYMKSMLDTQGVITIRLEPQ